MRIFGESQGEGGRKWERRGMKKPRSEGVKRKERKRKTNEKKVHQNSSRWVRRRTKKREKD